MTINPPVSLEPSPPQTLDAPESPPAPATMTADPRTTAAPGTLPAGKPRSAFRRGVEVFAENKMAMAGVTIFVLMALFCFAGPLIYHTDQVHVNLAEANLSPRASHPLGTDPNGYDVLGRLMVAGQISLEVGIAAALLATVVGVLWGATAGYLGGVLDAMMMRVVDALVGDSGVAARAGGRRHHGPVRAGTDLGDRVHLLAGPPRAWSAGRRCRCGCASTCRRCG